MPETPVVAPFGDPNTKTMGAGIATVLIGLALLLFNNSVPEIAAGNLTTGPIVIAALGVVSLLAGFTAWHLRDKYAKGTPYTPEQRAEMLRQYDVLIQQVKDPIMLAILKANREAIVEQILKSGNKIGEEIADEIKKEP